MNVFEGYYPTTNTLTHSSSIKFRNQSLIQYGKPWYYHLCDASELHLQDLFRDTPLDHIWHGILGTYLGTQNIVKWGVPEKILQNAVQTC